MEDRTSLQNVHEQEQVEEPTREHRNSIKSVLPQGVGAKISYRTNKESTIVDESSLEDQRLSQEKTRNSKSSGKKQKNIVKRERSPMRRRMESISSIGPDTDH